MNSLSVLNKYCVNYTAVAKNVNNSAIYGREQEVLDLMEVLVSSEKKKPVLIGDSGVGKKKNSRIFGL